MSGKCTRCGGPRDGHAHEELPGVEEYAKMLQRLAASHDEFMTEPKRRSGPNVPMTEHGREIAARFKEIFYHYDNRQTADNRSAQTHLGPSAIGTPCDRKLALSLLRHPPVALGGDGWAPFVGTQGHKGCSDMFVWSGGRTGRYLVDAKVRLPSDLVPRGTIDLYDRVTRSVWDFKFMGRWSLNKLRTSGPSETYRVQAHTYGLGLSIQGEDVKHVAIVGLPRESSRLDDMYVWDEAYNPQVARDALARVERIKQGLDLGVPAESFLVADDCKWCPYHMKGAKSLEHGCSGRQ